MLQDNPFAKGLTNRELRIVKAYGKGRAAQEVHALRSENPHLPSNEEFYWAWDAGWCWDEIAYTASV